MSTPPRPSLKSTTPTPTGPPLAPQPVDSPAVGEPKGAARKGVTSVFRPDPHTNDLGNPTPERPGIRISAPPVYRHHWDGARWTKRYATTPTAAYACPCGQTDTARGQQDVADLVTEYAAHKHFCTGAPSKHTERRAAA